MPGRGTSIHRGIGVGAARWRRLFAYVRQQAGFGTEGLNPRVLVTVLVLYGLLTVVFTYPVILHLFTQQAGSTDVYEYMWELWWAKRSLIDLHTSPVNVTSLYHPYGVQHPILLLDAYLMATSLPVVLLFSPGVAINLHLLSSYVLTGFTTYLLCFQLTRRHGAAFLAGVIFAFSPFRADRAAHGVISMALTYWLPLYVLFLLRLLRNPNIRNAALCGITLGFSILSSFLHLAHFVIPLTLVALAYQLFADRRSLFNLRFLRGVAVAGGLACLMILPFYLPLLKARMGGELDYFGRFGVLSHSAALLSFVVPPSFQLVLRQLGPVAGGVEELLPGRYYVVYLGVVALALGLMGLAHKRARLWAVVALVSGLLALGPLLHVTGDLLELTVAERTGYVVLPGALLAKLPLYEWARGPARFAELTIFSLAIMSSYGIVVLYGLIRRQRARAALLSGLLALLLLDYALFVPFPTQSLRVPGFYDAVQADRGEYGILDVGTERFNHEGMHYQIVHQHPIARGFIYRYPGDSQYYQKYLEQLLSPETDIINAGGLVRILDRLDIGLVVLHKLSEATVGTMRPYLMENLGDPQYEDEEIAAFEVPAGDAVSGAPDALLMLGEQWHPLETIDGVPSRWMVNDAVLYARVDGEGSYQLQLTAHPYQGPRHLEIFVGDGLVAEYHVGGMQSYVTEPFSLKSGEWTPIRFHVPEGCQVPSELGEDEGDERCLSMLFQTMDLLPVEPES
jgi:hypothetical protein